jgi:methyl-accepting chemotaxis protein
MGEKYPFLIPITCSILGGLLLFLGVVLLVMDATGIADAGSLVFVSVLIGTLLLSFATILLIRKNRYLALDLERIAASADALMNGWDIALDARSPTIKSLREFSERQNEIAEIVRKVGAGDLSSVSNLAHFSDAVSKAVGTLADDLSSSLLTPEKRAELDRSLIELSDVAEAISQGDLPRKSNIKTGPTGEPPGRIDSMIEALSGRFREIKEISARVDLTIANVESYAASLIRNCAEQSSHSETVAGAIASLARRSSGIAETAAKASSPIADFERQTRSITENLSENVAATQSVRLQVHESLKRTKRLGERSQELNRLVFDLEELADRINILALNTSLRAGGPAAETFHVAGDLEQMAERTSKITGQIAQLAQSVATETREASSSLESMTRDIILSTSLSDRSMRSAGSLAQDLAEAGQQIAELSDRVLSQAKAAEDLSRTMAGVSETTEMIRAGARSTIDAIRTSSQAALDLQSAIGTFKLQTEAIPVEAKELGNGRFVN